MYGVARGWDCGEGAEVRVVLGRARAIAGRIHLHVHGLREQYSSIVQSASYLRYKIS